MEEKIILAISLIAVLLIVAITFDDAFAAKDGNAKVTICHILPENPDNVHTITMSEKSVPSHLAHGDILGECVEDTTPPLAPTLLTPLDGAVIDKSEDTTIHFLSQLDDEVIISSYPFVVSDFEAPTLGLDDRGNRLVDNGFSYNGNSIDVEWYFTPYPLLTVQTGKQNVAEFKIYDNHGPDFISHFELAFGLAGGESIGMSKAVIKWDKSFDGIETVTLVDPKNVLDKIKVTTSEGSCSYELQQKCLIVKVVHTFRAPLEFNILGTNVWDIKRNAWQNYFNHGIEVVGDSLNPMITKMIPGPQKYEGLIEVMQVAKYSDIWIAQDGREFVMDTSGGFTQINESFSHHADTGIMKNRSHSEFADYKETQADDAITQLLEVCPTCLTSFVDFEDSWAFEYSESVDRLEILSYLKIIEERKAIKVLDDAQHSIAHPKAEIDRDDRPLTIILAEEILMKKILADERAYLKQVLTPQQ
jgi:hypothetical protein